MKTTTPLSGIAVPHALSAVQTVAISPTWVEWQLNWRKPQSPAGRMNMLHSVYDIDIHWKETAAVEDRILLLLDVADAYFSLPDVGGNVPKAEMQRIAAKAFKVLCNHVFIDHDVGRVSYLFSPRVFPKLLWFFRVQNGHESNFDPDLRLNGTRDHNVLGKDGGGHYLKKAKEFAKALCDAAWDFKAFAKRNFISSANSRLDFEATHALLAGEWEKVLDLMERLECLDIVLQYRPGPRRIKEMEKIVLSRKMSFLTGNTQPGKEVVTRLPNNLKNALCSATRSKLAEVVAILMMRHGVHY